MRDARAVSALALTVALAACTAIRPLDAPRDGAAIDVGARDAARPDAGPDDAGGDDAAATDDASTDVDAASVDAASLDASMDAGSVLPDAGRDAALLADAGHDAGSDAGAAGCADGTDEMLYTGGTMVGCDGSASQCDASMLCAPGWHLCTYSEYAARGGAITPADTDRWIASCLRDGPSCTASASPSDTPCSDCTRLGSSTLVIGQLCGGPTGTRSAIQCPLGVTASVSQLRLLSEVACLYVTTRPVDRLSGATCCR